MEWLKQVLPIVQIGLKTYISGEFIKKTGEGAKAFAVQSAVMAAGTAVFIFSFSAALIMSFVDLGNQLESGNVHFSGMMWSSVYLSLLGILVFVVSYVVAKTLSAKERMKVKQAAPEVNPYAPLILFGEELLKQLIVHLNEKKPAAE